MMQSRAIRGMFSKEALRKTGSFFRRALLVGGAIFMLAASSGCRKTYMDVVIRSPKEGQVVTVPIPNSEVILSKEGVSVVCQGCLVMKGVDMGSFSYNDCISKRTIYITHLDEGYGYRITVRN